MARKSAGQQRAIAFIMPVVVGIFMYTGKWPAGLMIYWFTSNVWSIAQQFVAERIMPVPAAAAAVLEKDKVKSARGKAGGKVSTGAAEKAVTQVGKSATGAGGRPVARTSGKSGGKSGAKRKRQKR
jgi:YidC/Oxa1 family membrane protein insertase